MKDLIAPPKGLFLTEEKWYYKSETLKEGFYWFFLICMFPSLLCDPFLKIVEAHLVK